MAPHSGWGMKSPVEYRKLMNQAVSLKEGSRADSNNAVPYSGWVMKSHGVQETNESTVSLKRNQEQLFTTTEASA